MGFIADPDTVVAWYKDEDIPIEARIRGIREEIESLDRVRGAYSIMLKRLELRWQRDRVRELVRAYEARELVIRSLRLGHMINVGRTTFREDAIWDTGFDLFWDEHSRDPFCDEYIPHYPDQPGV